MDELNLQSENLAKLDKGDDMKIVINLFDKVTEKEALDQKEADIQKTLVQLIDDFLEKRPNLTDTQKGVLAKVRSRIIIEFMSF